MADILITLAIAIGSAILYALIGYFTKYNFTDKEFPDIDIDKLTKTVISGIIAGVILLYLNLPITLDNVNYILYTIIPTNIFLVFIINKISNVIIELLKKYKIIKTDNKTVSNDDSKNSNQ